MVRAKGKVTFSNTSFDPAGFLTSNAMINPGYLKDNNRQNPKWNTWAFNYTGVAGNKAWIPSTYVMTFYDGNKLNDPGRGAAMYYQFPTTGTNQLGNENVGVAKSPGGSFWYPGADKTAGAGNSTGALKGADAGMPLLTAAESYFLQAEAVVVGIAGVSGTADAHFNSGIAASFNYTYQLPDGTLSGNPVADAASYLTANVGSRLVNFSLAVTTDQKIEAIITQKYLALNMVNCNEGWNEYCRTGYPAVTGAAPKTTFASSASQSSRPDRLPSRILYPTSEQQYNSQNMPSGISPFTSLIFWAK